MWWQQITFKFLFRLVCYSFFFFSLCVISKYRSKSVVKLLSYQNYTWLVIRYAIVWHQYECRLFEKIDSIFFKTHQKTNMSMLKEQSSLFALICYLMSNSLSLIFDDCYLWIFYWWKWRNRMVRSYNPKLHHVESFIRQGVKESAQPIESTCPFCSLNIK